MRHLLLGLIAIIFVSGCSVSPETADPSKLDTSKSSPTANNKELQKTGAETTAPANTTPLAKTTSDSKATPTSGSYIGIWKYTNPDEGFVTFEEGSLSQALEIYADGWFMFTMLTKSGDLHSFAGKWKKVSETKIEMSPQNFKLKVKTFIGELVSGETFEIKVPEAPTMQLVRATTDTIDYPATALEQAKFVGGWQGKESLEVDILRETQTLNADGTAVYSVIRFGGVSKFTGTWKLVTADVIVITGKQVNGDKYFRNTAKLIDKDTLNLMDRGRTTIFVRQ